MREYYVMTEGLSIVCVNVDSWYLNVGAGAIEHASACVAFKSAVDVSKLNYKTFLNLYQDQLFISDAATAEHVADEMDDLYSIFEKFKGLHVETQSRPMGSFTKGAHWADAALVQGGRSCASRLIYLRSVGTSSPVWPPVPAADTERAQHHQDHDRQRRDRSASPLGRRVTPSVDHR